MQVRDVSPRHGVKAHGQDVPPGYKRTEVGVIPEDWGVDRFGNLCSVMRGGSPRPIQNYITDSAEGINWIKIGDVGVGAKYIDATAEKIVPAGVTRSRYVRVGDFLLSNSMSFGRPYILRTEGCIHDGWLVIQDYHAKFDTEYLYYYLSAETVLAQYARYAAGSSVLNLNKELVSSISVAVLARAEQRAIAEAMSDVDGLLGALEALIAKKRAIKQAAMQQLLTGKTRLPGFSGEWETKSLEEVATRITGYWGAGGPSEQATNPVGVIRAGDISPLGELTGFAQRYFSDSELAKAACRIGDVVMTVSGNGLGKTWLVDRREPLAASNFVRILRANATYVAAPFLSYALKGDTATRLLAENTATSAYPNLRPGFFSTVWLDLPPIAEQSAIATVLSDMDAEVAALEACRDKTRQIKQGMMQELLTGRIRLIYCRE